MWSMAKSTTVPSPSRTALASTTLSSSASSRPTTHGGSPATSVSPVSPVSPAYSAFFAGASVAAHRSASPVSWVAQAGRELRRLAPADLHHPERRPAVPQRQHGPCRRPASGPRPARGHRPRGRRATRSRGPPQARRPTVAMSGGCTRHRAASNGRRPCWPTRCSMPSGSSSQNRDGRRADVTEHVGEHGVRQIGHRPSATSAAASTCSSRNGPDRDRLRPPARRRPRRRSPALSARAFSQQARWSVAWAGEQPNRSISMPLARSRTRACSTLCP